MKGNMKSWLVLMLVTFSLVVIVAPVGVCSSQVSQKEVRHPLELTPEQTLKTLLEAFIARDIERALAYVHPVLHDNPERIARLREGWGSYMTDRKHVKRIVEIRLEAITARGEDKVATLWTKIETTPRFSGVPDLGGNVREYRWSLRQLKGKGPWFHDGGGF